MAEASSLTLRLLTPNGTSAETGCDGVQLLIRDGADGQRGGLVGILRGHAPAVMALGEGPVLAYRAHVPVFRAIVSGGFASVAEDVVTVITDSVTIEQLPEEQ